MKKLNITQMLSIGGVIVAIIGTIFWFGWDVALLAGNVTSNTKEIGMQKAVDIDMEKWKVGHETLFIEQVFKAQARAQRIEVLEKELDNKLDEILRAVKK